jgi:hypothetical protein
MTIVGVVRAVHDVPEVVPSPSNSFISGEGMEHVDGHGLAQVLRA